MLHYHSTVTDQAELSFVCPTCEKVVIGHVEDRTMIAVVGFVPVWHRYTMVKCQRCEDLFRSRVRLEKLRGAHLPAIAELIYPYVPLPISIMPVLAILMCWSPIFGFGLASVSWWVTYQREDWRRAVSRVALWISGLVTAILLIALLVN